MSDVAVQINNISKSFDLHLKQTSIFETITSFGKKSKKEPKLNVLQNISFDVKKGELVGIIGKNGIGKTTLLRLISGIYRPDSGNICVDGKIALFLELGTGFQLELSARENIVLLGMILGFKKNDINKKIPEIIQFAELEKFLDVKLLHFSSGMFARLAFATAIQMDSDIFLIDELLSVGDAEFQKKSFETFMDLKKRGKSFIVVSHNHNMLKDISDKMICLGNGKIVAMGDSEKVIQAYENS